MLKIVYEQKTYDFGADVGGQPYDIKAKIVVNEDATATEAIQAFVKMLRIADYRITEESLHRIFAEILEEGVE